MAAYNAGPFLRPALESIRAQTERDWELIVVDDASTDGTSAELASCAGHDARIRVRRNERNRGVAWSLNRAAESARGPWLARMDADDVSHPARLAAQLHAATAAPAASAITCFIDVIDPRGVARAGARGIGFDEDLLPWFSLFYNRVGGGGQLLCALETFRAVGGFDETITYGEDRELWLRLLARGPVGLVRRPLYLWRSSAESETKRQQKRFRYSDDSLAAGRHAIEAWCGSAVSREEAVTLRDFWQRFDDGRQDWDEVQRRLLQLAAAYRGPGAMAGEPARRRSLADGWLSHAWRALSRRDRKKFVAHVRRARSCGGLPWPLVLSRWLRRLVAVRAHADRLI